MGMRMEMRMEMTTDAVALRDRLLEAAAKMNAILSETLEGTGWQNTGIHLWVQNGPPAQVELMCVEPPKWAQHWSPEPGQARAQLVSLRGAFRSSAPDQRATVSLWSHPVAGRITDGVELL